MEGQERKRKSQSGRAFSVTNGAWIWVGRQGFEPQLSLLPLAQNALPLCIILHVLWIPHHNHSEPHCGDWVTCEKAVVADPELMFITQKL